MIDIALKISLAVFMAASLAGVGLALSPERAFEPLRRAGFAVRILVAIWVIPPLLALALRAVVPLAPPYATGLWVLALAPCAPFAPSLVALAGGSTTSMAAVMLTSMVSTIVMMPLALPLAGDVPADPLAIAWPLVAFVLLPLAAGMAVRHRAPAAAAGLRRTLDLVSGAAGVIGLGLIGLIHGRGMTAAIGSLAIVTQLVFLVAIAVAVHLLGRGLDAPQRVTLTVCACTRNLGAALAPLVAAGGDPRAVVMVAIAVPATIVVGVVVALWLSAGVSQPRRVTHDG